MMATAPALPDDNLQSRPLALPMTITMAAIPTPPTTTAPSPSPDFFGFACPGIRSAHFSVRICVPFITDVSPSSLISSSKGEFCALNLIRHFVIFACNFSLFRVNFIALHIPALDRPIRNVP